MRGMNEAAMTLADRDYYLSTARYIFGVKLLPMMHSLKETLAK